jgi:ABC-type transport system involved in multi-copper enzyme maturation permease subunit
MYVWKCWRDTRAFFIVFLIIAGAAIPVTAALCKGTGLMRDFGVETVSSIFGLLTTVITLGLGTICAIHEFADKSVHFLFTKPRSRAYFVWVGWAVGCVEALAILIVNLASSNVTLALYSNNSFGSALRTTFSRFDTVNILIYGLFVYGLTYSLTVLFRNGLKGLASAMAVTTGLWNISAALRMKWNIEMPIPADRIGSLPMPVSNLLWILIALSIVFGAHLIAERAEI